MEFYVYHRVSTKEQHEDRGVYVIILEIPTTQQDFSQMENSMARMIMETINNMLIEMYAVFARVERREITPTALRKELGLSHSTFYRYRERYVKTKLPNAPVEQSHGTLPSG